VSCFYTTADAWSFTPRISASAAATASTLPVRRAQYPKVGNFGSRGKMDKCTYCAGGPEGRLDAGRIRKYGANRLRRGQAADLRRNVLDQVLLAGDGRSSLNLQGARDEAWLRSGIWGWKRPTAIHRPADPICRRPSRGGARVTQQPKGRCADAKLTFNSQGSLPGPYARHSPLLFVLAHPAAAQLSFKLRPNRTRGPASECVKEGDKNRADIDSDAMAASLISPPAATGAIFTAASCRSSAYRIVGILARWRFS